jgi:UDP-N-acetyl-D-glucosamine dehydrogenase
LRKFRKRAKFKVAILGQGYVGTSLARRTLEAGHTVVGFDTNLDVISRIDIKGSRYQATSDQSLIGAAEIIIIAVPTPLDDNKLPDLSALKAACEIIIQNVHKSVLIINESTSFPGTLRTEIASVIDSAGELKHMYASSPERVDPGNNFWNQKNTPRLLSGLTQEATIMARKFYSTLCDHVVEVSTPEIAESAKLFENTFRQVNIALVNEFAQISNALGISTQEVLNAAATKPFGFMSFKPGPGVGGHCIPIDPSYLTHIADRVGIPATFIRQANEVNLSMPAYVVSRVLKDVGSLKGKKVVVVGISYKANVSDTREAPAALVIEEFKKQGAEVSWHDSVVGTWNGQKSSELKGFDIAIVVTKHNEVSESAIKASAPYVFDCTGSIKGVAGL